MHDLALYRKYRPKNFKEVMGQDHIVKVLESSVETNKVSMLIFLSVLVARAKLPLREYLRLISVYR